MPGRPRAVWLIDSADPSGAAMMTVRRAHALRQQLTSTMLALSAPQSPVPGDSVLAGIPRAAGLAGEARIARADVVITTSQQTLASAAARLRRGARLLHVMHARPAGAVSSELFLRRITAAAMVGVPVGVDSAWFARTCGLATAQVRTLDDAVLPEWTLLASGHRPVFTAMGRLPRNSAVLDLIEGFRTVREQLPEWQLRVAGWGPGLEQIHELIARHRLAPQVLALGARHDGAALLRDSGYLVRLDDGDACGLSVLDGLAAGVPVVSTQAVPAAARFVRTEQNGLLLERTDPVAIGEALLALAGSDMQQRLRSGALRTVVPHVDVAGLRTLIDDTLQHTHGGVR